MKTSRQRKGQFVIIAVMLTAIMIVSIGALMHGAITYYKHEPWEEYSTLIGDIEINSRRVVELSLASYTTGQNITNIKNNLERWKNDLADIYTSSGITLTYSAGEPVKSLTSAWGADFTLNIASIGLKGYKFSIETKLRLTVSTTSVAPYNITAVVTNENNEPITDLRAESFTINNSTHPTVVSPYYNNNTLVYCIQFKGTFPATVEVKDSRGIVAVGYVG